MIALLRHIAGFTIAILLAAFAIFNRGTVNVSYSPLNEPLAMPLYAIVLGMFVLGFLVGAFLVWFNTAPVRRTRRQQRKQIKALEKELATVKHEPSQTPAPPTDFFPALPPH